MRALDSLLYDSVCDTPLLKHTPSLKSRGKMWEGSLIFVLTEGDLICRHRCCGGSRLVSTPGY